MNHSCTLQISKLTEGYRVCYFARECFDTQLFYFLPEMDAHILCSVSDSDSLVGNAANFMAKYEERFGYPGTYDSVGAYTAAYVYMLGIQKVGTSQ